MKEELVTIVTPSYKSKEYIEETINSVINQDYSNYEMIIVDDCSPDHSADFIRGILPDNRFRLIELSQNVGAAEARNVALSKANGRFVAFLDSDDIWYKEKLSIQIEYMKKHSIAFSFSSYDIIDENGKYLGKKVIAPKEINAQQYLGNTIIGCLTVIIDRCKVGEFRMPNLKSSHDMALWYEIMKDNNIKAYGINLPLASYRLLSTSNTANKYKAAVDVWRVYRDYLKIGFSRSCFLFISYAFNAVKKRVL